MRTLFDQVIADVRELPVEEQDRVADVARYRQLADGLHVEVRGQLRGLHAGYGPGGDGDVFRHGRHGERRVR